MKDLAKTIAGKALRPIAAAILFPVLSCLAQSIFVLGASAEEPPAFYAGKQMTLIVASDVGGGYDALARLTARYMGQFLPGHPNIVVQNMPGAGGLVAADYIYNIAPKDGTVIGLIQRSVLTSKFTNPNAVRFDLSKFNWIGNLGAETGVTVAWHAAPFANIEDVMSNEMIVAGTGPNNDSETTARLLNAFIGTKFKIVSGYKSTADQSLAMERGETQGMSDWSWSGLKARGVEYDTKKVRILLQIGLHKLPDLPKVPTAMDYVKTQSDREAMLLYLSQKEIARPVVAPPGVPPERTAALRSAFVNMFSSSELRDEARHAKLDLTLMDGADLQKIVAGVATASPEAGQDLQRAIAPKK
jgi:tripartite-type tricarboxylate transporter receptor subunit TctC